MEAEYEHEPVPPSARKSLATVSLVWLGFPMVLTMSVIGALVVEGLGFRRGVAAIVAGNLVLFVYVGALSLLAQQHGLSFALLSSRTLGTKGYVVASGLLSTIVLGWFAVQTGLTAASLNGAFHWPVAPLAFLAGAAYVALTVYGVRALATIGLVSAPLFLAFGAYAVYVIVSDRGWVAIASYPGSPERTLPFSLGVSLVVASFVGSGTMTADFTRWARTPLHALVATFSAFPLANGAAMLVGAVIAGAGAGGSDPFALVAHRGGVVAALAVAFLFANLGSVCSHCLYNCAVGWSHILGVGMRRAALVGGALGTLVAALGVWSYFVDWLSLVSIVIPPVGGVLLADHFFVRARRARDLDGARDFEAAPFLSWAAATVAAVLASSQLPWVPAAVVGMLAALVIHPILARLAAPGSERM